MKIFLDRYYNFFTRTNQPWLEVDIEAPARLSEVLIRAGIPPGEVHLVVINGVAFDPQGIWIHHGDQVKLYPPFGGG